MRAVIPVVKRFLFPPSCRWRANSAGCRVRGFTQTGEIQWFPHRCSRGPGNVPYHRERFASPGVKISGGRPRRIYAVRKGGRRPKHRAVHRAADGNLRAVRTRVKPRGTAVAQFAPNAAPRPRGADAPLAPAPILVRGISTSPLPQGFSQWHRGCTGYARAVFDTIGVSSYD